MNARLEVNDGLGQRIVPINKDLLSIGRRTESDLRLVGSDVSREHAEYAAAPLTLSAIGLHQDAVRDTRPALLALSGAVALLLLLVCVNVTTVT